MRSNKPTTETLEQFRDKDGALWCVQAYYPDGKRKGNDRYWIATIANITTGESHVCADVWALERKLSELKRGQMRLL